VITAMFRTDVNRHVLRPVSVEGLFLTCSPEHIVEVVSSLSRETSDATDG
jgi:hypothetical protein